MSLRTGDGQGSLRSSDQQGALIIPGGFWFPKGPVMSGQDSFLIYSLWRMNPK